MFESSIEEGEVKFLKKLDQLEAKQVLGWNSWSKVQGVRAILGVIFVWIAIGGQRADIYIPIKILARWVYFDILYLHYKLYLYCQCQSQFQGFCAQVFLMKIL